MRQSEHGKKPSQVTTYKKKKIVYLFFSLLDGLYLKSVKNDFTFINFIIHFLYFNLSNEKASQLQFHFCENMFA